MGRVTRNRPVRRLDGGRVTFRVDRLAVEEPLEIRLVGAPFAVTMRTPGNDVDLVHGFLHAEGIIGHRDDVRSVRYCAGRGLDGLNPYNVVDVDLADHVAPPDPGLRRNVLVTSACGMCGSVSIDSVLRAGRWPVDPGLRLDQAVVAAAPELLQRQQRIFARTGGLHGAGLLGDDGRLQCVREDVGRHNAVDKVIGWALQEDRLPLTGVALVVSGRASFELTQKAVLAGIGMLVAVSAPSSLAVELADESGLTLVGFVRSDAMNIYTYPERVVSTTAASAASRTA